jgi:periplasmic protein TonB
MLRAGVWAVGLHLLVLAGGGWLLARFPLASPRVGASAPAPLLIPGAGVVDDDPWIALDTPAALGVTPDELAAAPALRPDFPEADMANDDEVAASGPRGIADLVSRPAPDSGDGRGKELPVAWRRDSSTLRAQLSTAARDYQPSHQRTGQRASSPQANRRERRTGAGDSVRTEHPRPAEATTAEPAAPDTPAEQDDPVPEPAQERRTPLVPGEDTSRGEGALAADVGTRAFDVPTEGPARDNVATRLASNELQPGLIDYAAAAARGPGDTGRGPAAEPGITSAPAPGTAASFAGWPTPRPAAGGQVGIGSNEREFSRENAEIGRRVQRVLRFPQRLALDLEQGEAIVQFLVERDGRVRGEARLVKSAGFEEFDREAIEVVRRAAPYPRLAQARTVTLRIPFENPLVR